MTWRLALPLIVLAAFLAASGASAQLPNGGYMIIAARSGLCLTIGSPGVVQIQQFRCHGGPDQLFWLTHHPGTPLYRLQSQMGNHLCFDVEGASTDHGARVFQNGCHQGSNQAFRLIPLPDGSFQIRAAHSDLCLDTPNWYDGAGLHQAYCNRPDFQLWFFRRVN